MIMADDVKLPGWASVCTAARHHDPAGYLYKKLAVRPEWLKESVLSDVSSLSGQT
jgi:hypothetical protein